MPYTLLGADRLPYQSETPGQFGGHRKTKIYGRLDCPSALRAIALGGYVTSRVFFAIERAIIGKAVDLLSGPGGLASFLRRRQLGVRLGGLSLPLDIGYSETIPAGIRSAVTLRDKHCRWAGGYFL
jgi:hypothetical protein